MDLAQHWGRFGWEDDSCVRSAWVLVEFAVDLGAHDLVPGSRRAELDLSSPPVVQQHQLGLAPG